MTQRNFSGVSGASRSGGIHRCNPASPAHSPNHPNCEVASVPRMSRAVSGARHAVVKQHVATPHLPSRLAARLQNHNNNNNSSSSNNNIIINNDNNHSHANSSKTPSATGPTSSQPLLTFKYYPSPTALHNPVLLHTTRDFASDPSHPFHIRTRRRLADFDPKAFHWRVQCPVDVSKKAFIRNWAVRRVRRAVREELAGRGLGAEGAGEEGKCGGALLIVLNRTGERTLTAKWEDVRREVRGVLGRVRGKWEQSKRWERRDRG